MQDFIASDTYFYLAMLGKICIGVALAGNYLQSKIARMLAN